ncbi:hypothetical protein CCACVL1_28265 [Corchorus capsularis]|uniref:Uncharacterized protein n=1 Tax=Corchorus capsularis TaxID=210143 RepID=A0A1R3G729_COCAP|nr:hypothetical protein CCACVL1_28265 [Corchorus capsularis]
MALPTTEERISKEHYYFNFKSKQKKPKNKVLECGKALAQKLKELDKPFARTRDEPELNNMLKQKLRFAAIVTWELAMKLLGIKND